MYPVIKRSLDILTAGLGLLILSPLLIVIFLLILIQMGRPIIFKQMRPGLNGKPFYMYKFRTMTNEKDEQGNPLSDEQRLTRLGRFLRSTSLDELPELFNVLKGDMSLVGPRPLLMQYLARYTPEQARRHEAQPGITGWAQVNGRNAITWEEKFALDVWYVDNRSFWLDMRILAMTVVKVFRREGISAAGEATMPEFMGILKEPDLQYLESDLIVQEAAAAIDEEI
jgi:sugar transferase EpsL